MNNPSQTPATFLNKSLLKEVEEDEEKLNGKLLGVV